MPSPRPVARLLVTLLACALSGGVGAATEAPCGALPELAELLAPPDAGGDFFGFSVDVDGPIVVLGAPADDLAGFETGRALVHEFVDGEWVPTAELRSDVVRSLAQFGDCVAVDGELIAVGAPAEDEPDADAGAVHLFRRQPDGLWAHVQRLSPDDAARGDFFGTAVDLDSGRLAVGCARCPNPSVPFATSGAVYVFEDDGSGHYAQVARLASPEPQAGADFGHALALEGGLLVVGEPLRDAGSRVATGALQVHALQPDGSWAWEAELASPDQVAGERSGFDVALEEDRVAAGLTRDEGPVRVWRRSGPGGWALDAELWDEDAITWRFGHSVSWSDGRLVVATSDPDEPLAAAVFERDGLGTWSRVHELVPSDLDAGTRRRRLASDGARVVVAGTGHRHSTEIFGAAWLFGCNPPPTCDAGPPILEADCDGEELSGEAADPHGRELTVQWSSDCPDLLFSPSPQELDPQVLLDSSCGRECELELRVTADDGATCIDTAVLRVDDREPPSLTVPEELVLECREEGGVPVGDARVVAWLASAVAEDSCGEVVVLHDAPPFFPAGCAPGFRTAVRFTARDACGNETSAISGIRVVDSRPPAIAPGHEVLAELWAPNHRWSVLSAEAFSPTVDDACDSASPTWRLAGCRSDEAEDGRGDGRTAPDCRVAADGRSVSLRAERSGRGDGRVYELSIVAGDRCGNWSAPQTIGAVLVRHDRGR